MPHQGQLPPPQIRMVACQLKAVPLFARLDEAWLERLAEVVRSKGLRANSELFHQGDPGDALYIVAEGSLKVVVETVTGSEVTVATRGPGSILGELSLLDGKPRSASVVAVTACRLWTLTRQVFFSVLAQSPDIALALLESMSTRIREASERIQDLAHTSVRYRLAKLLADLAIHEGQLEGLEVLLPALSHESLGSLIGVKRETVTRSLSYLRGLDLIHQEGRRIVVKNLKGLRDLAQTLEDS